MAKYTFNRIENKDTSLDGNSFEGRLESQLKNLAKDAIVTGIQTGVGVAYSAVKDKLFKTAEEKYKDKNKDEFKFTDIDQANLVFDERESVITFLAQTVTVNGKEIELPEMQFYSAGISVSRNNVVVTKKVPNNNGSIKEILGSDDYNVQLRITLINPVIYPQYTTTKQKGKNAINEPTGFSYSDSKPNDDVIQLIKILDSHRPIPIYNSVLDIHGIYSIIPTSYSIDENFDTQNTYTLTIDSLSDDNSMGVIYIKTGDK